MVQNANIWGVKLFCLLQYLPEPLIGKCASGSPKEEYEIQGFINFFKNANLFSFNLQKEHLMGPGFSRTYFGNCWFRMAAFLRQELDLGCAVLSIRWCWGRWGEPLRTRCWGKAERDQSQGPGPGWASALQSQPPFLAGDPVDKLLTKCGEKKLQTPQSKD